MCQCSCDDQIKATSGREPNHSGPAHANHLVSFAEIRVPEPLWFCTTPNGVFHTHHKLNSPGAKASPFCICQAASCSSRCRSCDKPAAEPMGKHEQAPTHL